jgi:hypothetical protein
MRLPIACIPKRPVVEHRDVGDFEWICPLISLGRAQERGQISQASEYKLAILFVGPRRWRTGYTFEGADNRHQIADTLVPNIGLSLLPTTI